MAIVTSKFRTTAASSFVSTFAIDKMYLVLGRPQSWNDTLSTNFAGQSGYVPTDLVPPIPADNHMNESVKARSAARRDRIYVFI